MKFNFRLVVGSPYFLVEGGSIIPMPRRTPKSLPTYLGELDTAGAMHGDSLIRPDHVTRLTTQIERLEGHADLVRKGDTTARGKEMALAIEADAEAIRWALQQIATKSEKVTEEDMCDA